MKSGCAAEMVRSRNQSSLGCIVRRLPARFHHNKRSFYVLRVVPRLNFHFERSIGTRFSFAKTFRSHRSIGVIDVWIQADFNSGGRFSISLNDSVMVFSSSVPSSRGGLSRFSDILIRLNRLLLIFFNRFQGHGRVCQFVACSQSRQGNHCNGDEQTDRTPRDIYGSNNRRIHDSSKSLASG